MKTFTALLILLTLTGCANVQGFLAGVAGTSDRNEIERSYQNKEITKAEYLALKQQEKTNAALRNLKE